MSSSVDVRLRRAVAADAAFMQSLARTAYAHYVERIGHEPGPMGDDYERRVADDECWIAATEAGDVGFLVLRIATDHVLIDNVAVDPRHQGAGLGRRLLSFAEERARTQHLDELRLYTHVTMVENVAWYARLGYVETHRESEHGFRRVFMSKRLG